jgi:hypothetical protein
MFVKGAYGLKLAPTLPYIAHGADPSTRTSVPSNVNDTLDTLVAGKGPSVVSASMDNDDPATARFISDGKAILAFAPLVSTKLKPMMALADGVATGTGAATGNGCATGTGTATGNGCATGTGTSTGNGCATGIGAATGTDGVAVATTVNAMVFLPSDCPFAAKPSAASVCPPGNDKAENVL